MDLSRENIKKIRGLIIFTALLVVCLWKYDVVFAVLRFIFGVTFPFILGGAFAFVLNVPMNFIQRHLFPPKVTEKSKFMKKAARPLSMIAVILLVIGVVALVMLVLLPQLGSTLGTLGNSIQAFIPRVQKWAEDIFRDNDQISRWLGGLNFDWNRIMEVGMSFFSSGAGNMLDSTITVARSIISGLTTFFIACVFACYILLQKEKLNVQVRKVLYAFVPRGKAEAALEVFSLTYSTFSSFLTGQCVEAIILGTMFVIAMTIFQMPYALLVGVLIAFTALIPIFGAFIGCAIGAFMIPCGGQFRGTSLHLGTGSSQPGRKSDGGCGHAHLHPHRLCGLRPLPRNRVPEAEEAADHAGGDRGGSEKRIERKARRRPLSCGGDTGLHGPARREDI